MHFKKAVRQRCQSGQYLAMRVFREQLTSLVNSSLVEMQVTKGGYVGQTFALAKLNDSSGGKRSKRRSKDERKGMVETFVKRYQASNNGSFPSLHLTHKEVGGSYYTVREIFRELIQENRVLAPPKLSPGEQNMENLDSFLENYPLGSISFDPNVHGLQPKDNQTLLNEYELRRVKVLNSRGISVLHRQSLDNDNIINGSIHTTGENDECKDPRYRELLKGGGGIINSERSQISGTDVEETTHAAVINKVSEEEMYTGSAMEIDNKEQRNEGLGQELGVSRLPGVVVAETAHATLNTEVDEPKHTELLPGKKDEVKEVEAYQPQILPLSVGVVVETFPLRPVSSTIYDVDETSEKEIFDAKLEEVVSPLQSSKQIAILKTQNHLFTDENIDTSSEHTAPAEDKASSSPKGIGSLEQSTFEETTVNKNESDIQPCVTAQKQTVGANRINLESWEAASSEKSDSQETNPVMAFIKTFIAAVVKFWSE